MGKIKNYFRQQFQLQKFNFEYETASDFHVSCFQTHQSALPLLIIRGILFLSCIGIVLASFILTVRIMDPSFWPIYLTHWGLVLITLTTGFGFAVSARAYYSGPIDSSLDLPWYIKVYWGLYATTIPIAIFITIFYWIFLTNENEEYAVNFVLDIMIHAVNSVIMLVLLLTANHPSNLLHFYFSIILPIIYVIFTVIYYFAGGTDPIGNRFIYPVLDWSNAGLAAITVVFSAILILVLHILVVLMTEARNAIARSCGRNNREFSLSQVY